MFKILIVDCRRSIGGYSASNEFARQLAERNAAQQPQKKFRASAAPKGAKLPTGYVDRAKAREGEEESDKVQRVKALEEMMKLQQIDEATFVKLREDILGDDYGKDRAGLVKGLDWTLLAKARKGEVGVEDVLGDGKKEDTQQGEEEVDVDDEFEELEAKDVEVVTKEKAKKRGELAPSSLTGKKRTRDQILADMKAARLAAKEAAQPSLGSKFRKFGESRVESRIERDEKGREVLITVDENGNVKRKVRKTQVTEESVQKNHGLLMPDQDAKPLGMEVPDIPKAVEEQEDEDIFADVGDDYDPLAGLGDEDSDAEAEDGKVTDPKAVQDDKVDEVKSVPGSMLPPPKPKPAAVARNYFGDKKTSDETDNKRPAALSDPTLLAAIKKASTLNPLSKPAESEEEAAKEAKRKRMLQQDDRDAQDMDMGFGSSRFEDEEDFEEKRVKLSEWGNEDEDDSKGGRGEKGKRKRGPKKRKGDSNNAADVMAVLERRKGEK
jgi:hypothetical protein